MQVVSSYGAEIKNKNIPIRHTLALYREAVCCLTEIYETVWTELSMIDQIKRRFNEAEHLVHETKKNHARFDFDARFPKMPSYLRRAAIQHALGSVSSYHTRLEQWKNGAISGKPKLVYENHAMPVFYRNVMYKPGEGSEDAACLKLYDGHDWKWFRAGLLHTDMEYLRRHWSGKKSSAPVLEKRHQKYYLRFSYTEEVTLSKTPVKDQLICSVDLGINTDAVCSIMRSDGTVLDRKFINFPSEKDRLSHVLGRIRRFQKEHGSKQIGSRWAYAKRLNTELARKTARSIAEYAHENHADVIVFEYLEMKGKISGKINRNCIFGRNGRSRLCVNTKHTGMGSVCPVSAHGLPAVWRMMEADRSAEIRRTTACVFSNLENSITVICQHPTISERDTGSGKS